MYPQVQGVLELMTTGIRACESSPAVNSRFALSDLEDHPRSKSWMHSRMDGFVQGCVGATAGSGFRVKGSVMVRAFIREDNDFISNSVPILRSPPSDYPCNDNSS